MSTRISVAQRHRRALVDPDRLGILLMAMVDVEPSSRTGAGLRFTVRS